MLGIVLLTVSSLMSWSLHAQRPPSCLLELYDCVYYIWDHGDGTGDALVTCDEGSTFSFYSGRFGGCP